VSDDLEALCRRVLDGSWREGDHAGVPYAFTAPSPGRYPWQWYWDSCFIAIVRSRWDPERARRELESLLAASEGGFIGHVIFWGRPLNLERAVRYNIARRRDLMTRTIQPPLLAWAWSLAVGDPRGEPRIAEHHAWLRAQRDLEGDGLLWLIQPDESGLDASPKYDHVWGPLAQGRRLFPWLIHHNRRRGFDARHIAADGRPVLCEVLSNVMWSLAERALGRPSPTPALVARLWDERSGRFLDEARHARRPLPPERVPFTWDTLAPLALPDLPEEIGRRLVEEVLLTPRFHDGVPLPSVALDDPAYSPRDHYWGLRRYWRGPSWINSAWLAWLGLRRLGYVDEAAEMASRVRGTVLREGLREYYHPLTGAGMGATDFGWTALALEMAEPRTQAA
jgi:Mannosylglycerate hydrolase MGH1-like glycoside hydrolase domain